MATGNPRNKVALRPGRSLMDWVRLSASQDLSGTGGRQTDIDSDTLAAHADPDNAWTALRGRVYNISQYREYHPGGEEELMRAAGRDGTQLFDEVHRWVNAESMLKACLVGPYVTSGSSRNATAKAGRQAEGRSVTTPPTLAAAAAPNAWRWRVDQRQRCLVLTLQCGNVASECVCALLTRTGRRLCLLLYGRLCVRAVCWCLSSSLSPSAAERLLNINSERGELTLSYPCTDSMSGETEPIELEEDNEHDRATFVAASLDKLQCELVARQLASAGGDCQLLSLQLPEGCRLAVPLGCHLMVGVAEASGREEGTAIDPAVMKPYTPVAHQLDTLYDPDSSQLHLLLKVYSDGYLTPQLAQLPLGSRQVVVSVPCGAARRDPHQCRWLVVLAAGSGLTPMVRLVQRALYGGGRAGNDADSYSCRVQMALFNKNTSNIMWRDQLEAVAQMHEHRMQVRHVLSQQPDWPGQQGHVTEHLMRDLLSVVADEWRSPDDLLVAVCGPSGFISTCRQLLQKIGIALQCCDFYDG